MSPKKEKSADACGNHTAQPMARGRYRFASRSLLDCSRAHVFGWPAYQQTIRPNGRHDAGLHAENCISGKTVLKTLGLTTGVYCLFTAPDRCRKVEDE